jgi:hypothetical protein
MPTAYLSFWGDDGPLWPEFMTKEAASTVAVCKRKVQYISFGDCPSVSIGYFIVIDGSSFIESSAKALCVNCVSVL